VTVLQAIRTRLLAQPPLTTLVAARVYTLTLPQNFDGPNAIRLVRVSELGLSHLRGTTGLTPLRLQVDTFVREGAGDAYDQACAIDAAARGTFVAGVATGLAGFRGTVNGIGFTGILPMDTREQYHGDEHRMVRVLSEYRVWFTQE